MAHPRRPDKPCEWCRTPFHGAGPSQRFCSRDCARAKRKHGTDSRTHKSCPRCRETFPIEEFYAIFKGGRLVAQSYCNACRSAANAETRFQATLQRCYKMSLSDYDRLLAQQGGVCAICGGPPGYGGKRLAVDHDHSCCPDYKSTCGRCVRGLLCGLCNTGLGRLGDSVEGLRKALDYLLSPPAIG